MATENKKKHTTSAAVTKRYQDKTFRTYAVRLRKVEDADLIAKIEDIKARQNVETSEAFKRIMRGQ